MSEYLVHRPGEPLRADMFPDNAIFVFDFDGVIIEQCEEKVYRLPEVEGERDRLEFMAGRNFIDHSLYNTNYLRHLVYQAVNYDNAVGYTPVTLLIDELDKVNRPYFILTARSGYYAVQRLIHYCEHMAIVPQEVFCVGRGSKADLLAELLAEWQDRHIVFLDDNMHHVAEAAGLNHKRLTVVKVEHDGCTLNAERLAMLHLGN